MKHLKIWHREACIEQAATVCPEVYPIAISRTHFLLIVGGCRILNFGINFTKIFLDGFKTKISHCLT